MSSIVILMTINIISQKDPMHSVELHRLRRWDVSPEKLLNKQLYANLADTTVSSRTIKYYTKAMVKKNDSLDFVLVSKEEIKKQINNCEFLDYSIFDKRQRPAFNYEINEGAPVGKVKYNRRNSGWR